MSKKQVLQKMANPNIKISATAKSLAEQVRYPDYFFRGEVGFACGSIESVAVNWGSFVEARVCNERILILHVDEKRKGWLLSDFTTGVQITQDSARNTIWRKLDSLPDWANKLSSYPLINTREFMDAYWAVVMLIKNAPLSAKQAMLCACKDIIDGTIEY